MYIYIYVYIYHSHFGSSRTLCVGLGSALLCGSNLCVPLIPLTWGSTLPARFPFSSCRGVQPRQGWTSHNRILLDGVDRRVWVQSAPGPMGAGVPPPTVWMPEAAGASAPTEAIDVGKGGSPACPDGNRHRTMQAPRGTLRVSECLADRAGRIGRSECPTDQAPPPRDRRDRGDVVYNDGH